jgi:hypothetical protein
VHGSHQGDGIADQVIAAIGRTRVLQWIAPLGLAKAKRELRAAAEGAGTTIAPWTYNDFDDRSVADELSAVRRRAASDPAVMPALLSPALGEIDRALAAAEVLGSRDDGAFREWSVESYGLPMPDVVNTAREILAGPPPHEHDRPFDANALARRVESALASYGLDDWSVVLDPAMVVTMSVRGKPRRVAIREDARFSEEDVRRLLAHEVGSHVLRTVNARAQPETFARLAFGQAVRTEEGLAAWHEEHFGVATASSLTGYAARVLAVGFARDHGIVETTRLLAETVGIERAVDVAVRVKRGLLDPNEPGAFTKDHAYLTGLLELRASLAQDPGQHLDLMATKWPIDAVPLTRELVAAGDLIPPVRLPDPERLGLWVKP